MVRPLRAADDGDMNEQPASNQSDGSASRPSGGPASTPPPGGVGTPPGGATATPPGGYATASPGGYASAAPGGYPSSSSGGFFDAMRDTGIRRPREGRWLGGVAAGIGNRFGLDAVLVRVAVVVLTILFGLGLTVYLIAWVLLPDENGAVPLQRAFTERDAGSIVLTVFAGLSLLGPTGVFNDGGWSISLLAIAILATIWYVSTRRPTAGRPAATVTPTPGAVPVGHPSRPGVTAAHPGGTQATTWASTSTDPSARPGTGPAWPATGPGGPGSGGPHPTPAPGGPPAWQPPPRPRRRGGGLALALIALGLALITFQAVRMLADSFGWSGSPTTLAWAAVVAVLGLLVLVTGLAGWRLGFVGVVTAVLAILTALVGLSPGQQARFDGDVGDRQWAPQSAGELQNRYSIGFGSGRLDLSNLPAGALDGRRIDVQVGFGELDVILPPQGTVTLQPNVGFGDVEWDATDGRTQRISGPARDEGPIVMGEGSPQLVLNANVGFGSLDLERK